MTSASGPEGISTGGCRLTETVDDVLTAAGHCLLIDGHSFSAHPMPHEPDHAPDRPDICIGTDPSHTPPDLTAAPVEAPRRLGFSVAIDRPFSGALVPAKHYLQDARVRSIMIEVNRKLYSLCSEKSGTMNVRTSQSHLLQITEAGAVPVRRDERPARFVHLMELGQL